MPGIVVCGAQSAGKSSVLEYLSDLNFPRAETTCTRCPTVVSLATDPTTPKEYVLIGLEAKKEKQERIDEMRNDAKMKQAAFFALAKVPVEAVQAFL